MLPVLDSLNVKQPDVDGFRFAVTWMKATGLRHCNLSQTRSRLSRMHFVMSGWKINMIFASSIVVVPIICKTNGTICSITVTSFRLYTSTTPNLPTLDSDVDVLTANWDGRLAQSVIRLDMTMIWRTATNQKGFSMHYTALLCVSRQSMHIMFVSDTVVL